MKKSAIILILFFSFLAGQNDQRKFHLNDGTVVVGEVISENDSTITIQSKFGTIVIRKDELVSKKSADILLDEIIREDVEFDFTIGHTALAQYHGLTLTALTENALTLLINGGSYFVVSGLAHRLNDLTRIKTENSIAGHINGIMQGLLIMPLIVEDPESKYAMLTGSIGGLYHAYHSFKSAERLPEYQSAFVLSAERYAPAWMFGFIYSMPDETRDNILEYLEDHERMFPALLLTTSLSANFWAPKLIGHHDLSYGDYLTSTYFHYSSLFSAFTLITYIEPENYQLPALLFLGASGLGLYQGIRSNEGQHFTFEEGRFVGLMTGAGGALGMGLAFFLEVDEFKSRMALTSAGIWSGYFYGKSRASNRKNTDSAWDIKFNPENILLFSRFNKPQPYIRFPLLEINYSF